MRPGARRRPETLAGAAVAVAVAVAGTALAAWLSRGGGSPEPAVPGALAPGTIMTVAGGVGGPGPARRVSLDTCGLSYAGGALYAGDGAVVRRIDARTGWLTTPAGDGTSGTRGNGGPATDAQLGLSSCPSPALDAAGNLLIADGAMHVVAARTGAATETPQAPAGRLSPMRYPRPAPPWNPSAPRWTRRATWCWLPTTGSVWWRRERAGSTAST